MAVLPSLISLFINFMGVARTQVENNILQIIEKSLSALKYEVVRIRVHQGPKHKTVQIMIERQDSSPITLDDCENASQQVSVLLDMQEALNERYYLEISSPGVNRPLTRLQDFIKYQGSKIKVATHHPIDNRRRFIGTIKGLQENEVVLELSDNAETLTINFEDIADAYLQYSEPFTAKP